MQIKIEVCTYAYRICMKTICQMRNGWENRFHFFIKNCGLTLIKKTILKGTEIK